MRLKCKMQIDLSFQSSTLKVTQEYHDKYEKISKILDRNPQIVDRVHEDLKTPLRNSRGTTAPGGVFKYTSDNVLRILIAQSLEGESLRGIVVRIDDSNFLRHFVRIDQGTMMDSTTLCKLKNSIRNVTWTKINELLAQDAVKHGEITGQKLRLDTTAVETDIHWPTDSSLLWDTYRSLALQIQRAREINCASVGNGRLQTRRAKLLYTKISRRARGKGKSAAKALKPLYRELIRMVEGISEWSRSVAFRLGEHETTCRVANTRTQAVINAIEEYDKLGQQVISQARRRVLQDESVPNDEKLFSIFEPHTELLKRGKAGKPIEFGHMIEIQQVEQKFITGYTVFEKKPVEHQLLTPAAEHHRKLFKDYPQVITADKGYYESMQALETLERTIPVVSIGKKGKRTTEETEREQNPLFKLAQRFRAGVEGSISFLKRLLRLHRCFNRGWEHFVATVGQTVFAHNLCVLARC